MIKKNILTLIPDKHYYETYRNRISENFSSFSSKNGFSGIAIHTIPQLGIPVSVARYLNGRIISSVMMVSDTEVGMVENARKAFSIIGPMTIRSKVRLMTKSSGCDSNGSYGEGVQALYLALNACLMVCFGMEYIIGMTPMVMGCRMYDNSLQI